jgi:hypothetical protein
MSKSIICLKLKKTSRMRYIYFVLLLILPFLGKAQTGTYTDPYFFETATGLNIPVLVNNSGSYPIGADSSCLPITNNATFISIRICQNGPINLQISDVGNSSLDIDFIMFGPLANPLDTTQFINANVVDCGNSPTSIENPTIPNGINGEYYVLSVINYSNLPGMFTVQQISGAGTSYSSGNCTGPFVCAPANFNQPICEVTTDTSNQYWTVVFERDTTYGQLTYQIQRESTVQGQYLTIGTVAPGDSSVFTDNSVFAQQQAQRYRINTIDSCGNQRLGAYHQTMHLVTSSGVNNLNQLIWTPYTGFSYGTYFIYRGTSMNNMVLIDSISASYTSYTDMNSPVGLSYYQVSVVPPSPCVATRSLSFAKSNVSTKEYLHVGVGESVFASLSVYPNPSNGLLQVKFDQTVRLEILDISGRMVRSETLSAGSSQLNLDDLQDGMYVLRFSTTEGICTKNMVIQH